MKLAIYICLVVAAIMIITLLVLLFIRKNPVKTEIMLRFALVYICIALGFGVIIWKIIDLQYVEGKQLRALTEKQQSSNKIIKANRGNILSDDGRLMASSIPTYYIYMDLAADALVALPKDTLRKDFKLLSEALAKKFNDKTAKEYETSILNAYNSKSRKRREYLLFPTPISYTDLTEVKTFPIIKKGRYGGGFYTKKRITRIKPFGSLASRTIGDIYGEEDKGGRNGLEKGYNDILRGVDGVYYRRKMAGKYVDIIECEAKDGLDVVSTINIDLQDIVDKELRSELIRIGAKCGTAILMEVKTGEIKAISNFTQKEEGIYTESTNIAVADEVEPGSTFKTLSLMVALEDGVIDTTDHIDVGGGIKAFGNRQMKDWTVGKQHGLGVISVPTALAMSSNVGISALIYNHYGHNPQQFVDGIKKTKIDAPISLEIPGHGNVKVKTPGAADWYNTTLPWMSIGYEVQLPPIFTLMYYNAFANNGKMLKPLFTKQIQNNGLIVKKTEPVVINEKICSDATLGKIHSMLEGVVTKGTAKVVKSKLFSIAGKTGTAQIAVDGKYRDAQGRTHHQISFCGYFPANAPIYSCIVYIKDPAMPASAGGMCGMVFKNIAEKAYTIKIGNMPDWAKDTVTTLSPYVQRTYVPETKKVLSMLNIPYQTQGNPKWGICSMNPTSSHLQIQPIEINEGIVPSTIGMTAKDAVFLLENMGLRVSISGCGKVIYQSIAEGTHVQKGMHILLTLN